MNIKDESMDPIRRAEETITLIKKQGQGRIFLTMTQLRKFLVAVNRINNKVMVWQSQNPTAGELPAELVSEIKYLEVKLLYQCGRERNVKDFEQKTDLTKQIRNIGNDKKKYEQFAKFMEAVVAFHKFEGGAN